MVEYKLVVPNPGHDDNGIDFPDSVYSLTACPTSKTLKELKCNCAFYVNYKMICWHCLHLLERLQIKNVGAFEHLKKWREFVGYKSLNTNDKRDTSTYKVKKDKRLRSFMEIITKKRMKKLEEVCKEKGIEMKMKKVGETVSSGEEDEWNEINKIV